VSLVGSPDQDCLCPKCLAEAIANSNQAPLDAIAARESQKPPLSHASLVEGEDFYWEGAAMVFTASYHLRRGYCCESGCRHCPYEDAVGAL
jgi:Family of unknown function (DUF5522)